MYVSVVYNAACFTQAPCRAIWGESTIFGGWWYEWTTETWRIEKRFLVRGGQKEWRENASKGRTDNRQSKGESRLVCWKWWFFPVWSVLKDSGKSLWWNYHHINIGGDGMHDFAGHLMRTTTNCWEEKRRFWYLWFTCISNSVFSKGSNIKAKKKMNHMLVLFEVAFVWKRCSNFWLMWRLCVFLAILLLQIDWKTD